jgi:hypothetical protein
MHTEISPAKTVSRTLLSQQNFRARLGCRNGKGISYLEKKGGCAFGMHERKFPFRMRGTDACTFHGTGRRKSTPTLGKCFYNHDWLMIPVL